MKPIPYSTQWINDSDVEAVVEALKSDFITQGPRLQAFEEALAEATGARYAVAVANGTAALHLAVKALGVKSGDLGITAPITFAASANCFLYCGADVAFTDVDPKTGLMDVQSLAHLLAHYADNMPKGVIIPVSQEGRVPDLKAIKTLADAYGWAVVEDAAHSLGAEYIADQIHYKSGSCVHTDAAILSFHPVKNICAAEGGAVLTNDVELANKVRALRSHCIRRPAGVERTLDMPSWFYEQTDLGYNYRLSDLHAALGHSQLKRLRTIIDNNRALAQRYYDMLSEAPFTDVFSLPPYDPHHAYHLFVIHFHEESMRNAAFDYLKEQGIITQVHYVPVYRHSYYVGLYGEQALPGAESYYQGCLTIPLFARMTPETQQIVVDHLSTFCLEHVPTLCVTRS